MVVPDVAGANRSRGITTTNRIVVAISKHVVTEQSLAGGDEGVGVEEAAECGIVITGL